MAGKHSLPPPSPASPSYDDDSGENLGIDPVGDEDEEELDSPSQEIPKSTPKKKKPAHKPSSSKPKPAAPARSDAASERSKRNKRKLGPSGDAEERRVGSAGPLWSEEDEVAILKGIKAFREEKGSDPFNDFAAFLEFVGGSLSVVVSRRQLGDKARKLRKKYALEGEGVFVKPRDRRLFEIAKEIWGGGDMNGSAGESEKKQASQEEAEGTRVRKSRRVVEEKQAEKSGGEGRKGNEEVEKEERMKGDSDFESSYPHFHAALMDFLSGSGAVDVRNLVRQNLGLSEERARVLEPQLDALYVEELKLRSKKIRLLELVADAGVEIVEKGSQ